ncbi:Mobile element protein [Geobacillus stearothermophilus]|uniref:Mobile element protein n=1 Tax=Geobacillus stearothermophilus TaxID=1422 RepID=A0ABQ7HJJ1_GEOSE|nr:Mobile element protein [Geobacillus stearothermophilus]
MDMQQLTDFLRQKGRNRFADPEYIARSIQKATRSSYRLSKCVEDFVDLILGLFIQSIRTLSNLEHVLLKLKHFSFWKK